MKTTLNVTEKVNIVLEYGAMEEKGNDGIRKVFDAAYLIAKKELPFVRFGRNLDL